MAADTVRTTEGKAPVTEHESGKEELPTPPAADDTAQDGTTAKPKENHNENCPASPIAQPQSYQQAYLPHLTPQPGAGYYVYQQQPQVTPEPPSPGGLYDVTSYVLRQQALGAAAANPFGTFGTIPQPPLSPSGRTAMLTSPLFSRTNNVLDDRQLPYMTSPQLGAMTAGFGAVYQGYASNGYGGVDHGSPEDNGSGWAMSNQHAQNAGYPQASPQLQSMMYGRPGGNNRSQSFDDMLPPSMLEHQDQLHAPYSPYGASQVGSSGVPTGSPMFTHQQQPPWGYGATADMYGAPPSPLQPRPIQQGGYPGMARHMPYGAGMPQPQIGGMPFYPATSPGPPIQTTTSNKGPDGANLFVFHIPNHFTNLDMYSLFCQYGNLLSVRIMVEKDSGRSRGFGFVSYDSPESAAMAIKELNGFAIGNKRLKVQHKQIRSSDQQRGFGDVGYGSPSAVSSPWFDTAGEPAAQGEYPDGDHEGGDVDPYLDQTGLDMARSAGATGLSPLSNMDPLRSALPDAHTGTVE